MPSPFRMLIALAIAASLSAADPKGSKSTGNYNISLWEEGKVPLATGNGPLDIPFLTVFLPPEGKRNGTVDRGRPGWRQHHVDVRRGRHGDRRAVQRLGRRRRSCSPTGFRPSTAENARVLDGNRAVQLVRARGKEWGLDADKIGFAGFSAGSTMGRAVVAAAKAGDPNAADPLDRVSLAARLPGAGLRRGPGGGRRAVEGLSADVPAVRGLGSRQRKWLGAVVPGNEPRRRSGGAAHLSEGTARIRSGVQECRVRSVDGLAPSLPASGRIASERQLSNAGILAVFRPVGGR